MMRTSAVSKLFGLSSSIETISHQFIQRCSVSGTAKGKGKVKGGQVLKRSKVTIKKGGKPATTETVEKYREDSEKGRFNKMLDECLNTQAPIRHLKPKEVKREAEREKMGLISKARAQEIDKLKKMKKSAAESPSVMGTPGLDYISLGLVDADKIPKYEITVEDGKRLAKEYSRVMMRKHRARQAAESNLLRMKKEAIEALPENLKVAALVPDLTPFPANRFMATLTPPIEGYYEKMKEAANRSSGKQKLR
ncbi:uncharacterized protein LOC124918930 [Impatiens glandulifera]|uniref:uncharacterized protein LOC124918930 n=1 Tax=Impatiens glandulifera TaxID=253017 RepID=UPI001FB04CAD|nr:uncharacterized protein LOC124918930 [Impatiens glandulifera]